MAAGFHHFIIEQGATFKHTLTLKDSADALINLTGYTAEMDLRKTQDASTEVATFTVDNGRLTLGGSAGTIIIEMSASDTANLSVGDGVYDLDLQSAGGQVDRLLEGTFSVRGNVSR